eukprot:SAG31_NODE_31813_length_363_cov_5.420455_1_plen_120_part_11
MARKANHARVLAAEERNMVTTFNATADGFQLKHIALNGGKRCESLAWLGQLRTGTPVESLQHSEPQSGPTLDDGNIDSSRDEQSQTKTDANEDADGTYPIDESQIDSTIPEMKEWADAIL